MQHSLHGAIFRTRAYLEPKASSKACQTCKMIMHNSEPRKSLFKHFQRYLATFRNIDAYSATFTNGKLGRRGEASPFLFENRKKCPNFLKKGPDCVHLWVKFYIQNVVLKVPRRKISTILPCGVSFSSVFHEMFIAPVPPRLI